MISLYPAYYSLLILPHPFPHFRLALTNARIPGHVTSIVILAPMEYTGHGMNAGTQDASYRTNAGTQDTGHGMDARIQYTSFEVTIRTRDVIHGIGITKQNTSFRGEGGVTDTQYISRGLDTRAHDVTPSAGTSTQDTSHSMGIGRNPDIILAKINRFDVHGLYD